MTLTNDTGGLSLMGYNKKERAAVTAPQTPENSRYGLRNQPNLLSLFAVAKIY